MPPLRDCHATGRGGDRKRIQGIIINKFRGDIDLLKPGIAMLRKDWQKRAIPFLFWEYYLAWILPLEEDSLSSQFLQKKAEKEKIVISILKGKQMGNTTDFQPFVTVFRCFVTLCRKS